MDSSTNEPADVGGSVIGSGALDSLLSRLLDRTRSLEDRESAAMMVHSFLLLPKNHDEIVEFMGDIIWKLSKLLDEGISSKAVANANTIPRIGARLLGCLCAGCREQGMDVIRWVFKKLEDPSVVFPALYLVVLKEFYDSLSSVVDFSIQNEAKHDYHAVQADFVVSRIRGLLESSEDVSLLVPAMVVLLCVSQRFPSHFLLHFESIVDILVAWRTDTSLDASLAARVDDCFAGFGPFWIQRRSTTTELLVKLAQSIGSMDPKRSETGSLSDFSLDEVQLQLEFVSNCFVSVLSACCGSSLFDVICGKAVRLMLRSLLVVVSRAPETALPSITLEATEIARRVGVACGPRFGSYFPECVPLFQVRVGPESLLLEFSETDLCALLEIQCETIRLFTVSSAPPASSIQHLLSPSSIHVLLAGSLSPNVTGWIGQLYDVCMRCAPQPTIAALRHHLQTRLDGMHALALDPGRACLSLCFGDRDSLRLRDRERFDEKTITRRAVLILELLRSFFHIHKSGSIGAYSACAADLWKLAVDVHFTLPMTQRTSILLEHPQLCVALAKFIRGCYLRVFDVKAGSDGAVAVRIVVEHCVATLLGSHSTRFRIPDVLEILRWLEGWSIALPDSVVWMSLQKAAVELVAAPTTAPSVQVAAMEVVCRVIPVVGSLSVELPVPGWLEGFQPSLQLMFAARTALCSPYETVRATGWSLLCSMVCVIARLVSLPTTVGTHIDSSGFGPREFRLFFHLLANGTTDEISRDGVKGLKVERSFIYQCRSLFDACALCSGSDGSKNRTTVERVPRCSHSDHYLSATSKAAHYCVMSRLRTHYGNPVQTFQALEGLLKTAVPQHWSLERLRCLLKYAFALERFVTLAVQGAHATRPLAPSPKHAVAMFFKANRNVANEWFQRLRPLLVYVSFAAAFPTGVIFHGMKLCKPSPEQLSYLVWALRSEREPEALRGLCSSFPALSRLIDAIAEGQVDDCESAFAATGIKDLGQVNACRAVAQDVWDTLQWSLAATSGGEEVIEKEVTKRIDDMVSFVAGAHAIGGDRGNVEDAGDDKKTGDIFVTPEAEGAAMFGEDSRPPWRVVTAAKSLLVWGIERGSSSLLDTAEKALFPFASASFMERSVSSFHNDVVSLASFAHLFKDSPLTCGSTVGEVVPMVRASPALCAPLLCAVQAQGRSKELDSLLAVVLSNARSRGEGVLCARILKKISDPVLREIETCVSAVRLHSMGRTGDGEPVESRSSSLIPTSMSVEHVVDSCSRLLQIPQDELRDLLPKQWMWESDLFGDGNWFESANSTCSLSRAASILETLGELYEGENNMMAGQCFAAAAGAAARVDRKACSKSVPRRSCDAESDFEQSSDGRRVGEFWLRFATWCDHQAKKRDGDIKSALEKLHAVAQDPLGAEQVQGVLQSCCLHELVPSAADATTRTGDVEDNVNDTETNAEVERWIQILRGDTGPSAASGDRQTPSLSLYQDELYAPHVAATHGYVQSLAFETSHRLTAALRVTHFLANYAGIRPVFCSIERGLAVPTDVWRSLTPQLLALLGHPVHGVSEVVQHLLDRLARQKDGAKLLVFHAVGETLRGAETATKLAPLLDIVREVDQMLVSQVSLFLRELERISTLWEEAALTVLLPLGKNAPGRIATLVHELQRIRALGGEAESESAKEKDVAHKLREKHLVVARPAVVALEKLVRETIHSFSQSQDERRSSGGSTDSTANPRAFTPRTPHEQSFIRSYGAMLERALDALRDPNSEDVLVPGRAWMPLRELLNELTPTSMRLSYHLSEISSALATLRGTQIPIPGLHGSDSTSSLTISAFGEDVVVLPTKTRPRRLYFLGSDGKRYSYLLKGKEDLHLDERIMQFLDLTNELLRPHNPSLSARRYTVIPFGYRVGLIQMIEDSAPLFFVYKEWCKRTGVQPLGSSAHYARLIRALRDAGVTNVLSRTDWPRAVCRDVLSSLMTDVPSHLLANELWLASQTALEWWQRTTTFARSLAVMSMVGYVIGLGDRHLDNILCDFDTGSIVHVDFSICFGKGMNLRVPEVVPFRLTPFLEHALGPPGARDGLFAASCAHVLRVLRQNQSSVLALLEAFVYDPLVDWTVEKAADRERQRLEVGVAISLFRARLLELLDDLRVALEQIEKAVSPSVLDVRDLLVARATCSRIRRERAHILSSQRKGQRLLEKRKRELERLVIQEAHLVKAHQESAREVLSVQKRIADVRAWVMERFVPRLTAAEIAACRNRVYGPTGILRRPIDFSLLASGGGRSGESMAVSLGPELPPRELFDSEGADAISSLVPQGVVDSCASAAELWIKAQAKCTQVCGPIARVLKSLRTIQPGRRRTDAEAALAALSVPENGLKLLREEHLSRKNLKRRFERLVERAESLTKEQRDVEEGLASISTKSVLEDAWVAEETIVGLVRACDESHLKRGSRALHYAVVVRLFGMVDRLADVAEGGREESDKAESSESGDGHDDDSASGSGSSVSASASPSGSTDPRLIFVDALSRMETLLAETRDLCSIGARNGPDDREIESDLAQSVALSEDALVLCYALSRNAKELQESIIPKISRRKEDVADLLGAIHKVRTSHAALVSAEEAEGAHEAFVEQYACSKAQIEGMLKELEDIRKAAEADEKIDADVWLERQREVTQTIEKTQAHLDSLAMRWDGRDVEKVKCTGDKRAAEVLYDRSEQVFTDFVATSGFSRLYSILCSIGAEHLSLLAQLDQDEFADQGQNDVDVASRSLFLDRIALLESICFVDFSSKRRFGRKISGVVFAFFSRYLRDSFAPVCHSLLLYMIHIRYEMATGTPEPSMDRITEMVAAIMYTAEDDLFDIINGMFDDFVSRRALYRGARTSYEQFEERVARIEQHKKLAEEEILKLEWTYGLGDVRSEYLQSLSSGVEEIQGLMNDYLLPADSACREAESELVTTFAASAWSSDAALAAGMATDRALRRQELAIAQADAMKLVRDQCSAVLAVEEPEVSMDEEARERVTAVLQTRKNSVSVAESLAQKVKQHEGKVAVVRNRITSLEAERANLESNDRELATQLSACNTIVQRGQDRLARVTPPVLPIILEFSGLVTNLVQATRGDAAEEVHTTARSVGSHWTALENALSSIRATLKGIEIAAPAETPSAWAVPLTQHLAPESPRRRRKKSLPPPPEDDFPDDAESICSSMDSWAEAGRRSARSLPPLLMRLLARCAPSGSEIEDDGEAEAVDEENEEEEEAVQPVGNVTAVTALRSVAERLAGFADVPDHDSEGKTAAGVPVDSSRALTVEEQVKLTIESAVSLDNLSVMWEGWAPWL